MRYQMDSQNAGELESSAYVALDRDPTTNPAIFCDCSDLPSLTRQEFADECDVNTIMAQYEKTGIFPAHVNGREPKYLDVTNVPNLQDAMAMLHEATDAFMTLPAKLRFSEFDNDPVKFVAFCENPENIDKLREWKLAEPLPVEVPPQRVEIVNPPEAPPAK